MSESTWIELVRRIVAEVSRSDATEVEVSRGTFRLSLRRQPPASIPVNPAASQAAPMPEEARELLVVSAPLTGVFYRSPSPNTPPYVEESDWVEPQTVVGLIETMKVFNEVTADTSGRVVAALAQSGQLVHAGDPLFSIEPASQPTGAPEVIS